MAGEVDGREALRRAIADVDPRLPILDERTMEEQAATSFFPQKLALWVSGSLSLAALFLALIGIYGVVAYSVAQRTREIGVRVALGAERRMIIGMVLRRGVVLAGAGVLIGSTAAFALSRLLAPFYSASRRRTQSRLQPRH
jgi:ABC-type antimicrobial peptide transport system permease subunit